MFEAVIRGLIGLCLIVVAFFVALWVFGELGIVLPAMVITIAKVILVLIAILVFYRIIKPHAAGWLP